jgi:hypothetical protein
LINKKVFRSTYLLNIFTELAKARREDQTFEELLALENHEPIKKVYREFEYRLNRLFTHPLLGDMLDSGEIDFCVFDALEQFSKMKLTGRLVIWTEYAC